MIKRAVLIGLATLCIAGAGAGSASAQASPELLSALRTGIVGERFDGYMGFAGAPSQAVRREAGAINIRRRTLYIGFASRRNITPQVAGIVVGCQLLARVPAGGAYMLSDGVWRRRAAGEPPVSPPHCRTH